METSKNYWDFVDEIIVTPVTILKEQADFLTKTTKGILVGEIVFEKKIIEEGYPKLYTNKFQPNVVFNISSPILGYTYQLMSVLYDVKENYPIQINFDNGIYEAKDEESFKKFIQECIQSDTTKKIIQNLYSQSKVFENNNQPKD